VFGSSSAVSYLESLNFTESAFVFVVMCMAATRPVMKLAGALIDKASSIIPGPRQVTGYITLLTLGPLLGSFITEPAAMTVTAYLLKDRYLSKNFSNKFKYATLGLLFVNISIGGTLTHFAAPPVLMVASTWKWDTPFMFATFGIKAMIAIAIATILITAYFYKELSQTSIEKPLPSTSTPLPGWIAALHLCFLGLAIYHSHHMAFFIPLFLLFIGMCVVTAEYQDELRIKESLLVAFFLGGLVTLGNLQDWWLKPLIVGLSDQVLYFGAIGLTAFTDNAALTYLGSLVPDLSESAKYFLVAGAVTGGGLTVIANAPNPAGYGILQSSFGKDGISPLYLFLGALVPTAIAAITFLF
jgi:Na+/H+ antiporter NhaD/arsenite permease-like protein